MNRTCRYALLLSIGLLGASAATAQQAMPVYSGFTTASFRQAFYQGLLTWSIRNNLSKSLPDTDNAYDFQSAFWPMELILYKSPYVKQRLDYAFLKADSLSEAFQRGLLEVVYTNWPDSFRVPVRQMLERTRQPEILALAAEYLLRGHPDSSIRNLVEMQLQRDPFDTLTQNPVLEALSRRLDPEAQAQAMPPLTDLLSEAFAAGLPVIYSFQRPDRNEPGLAVVRQPDGHFVRNPDGSIFHVPQLARAISNLPYYLTNGNTPQGIFRMSGFAVSSSRFIGPTTNIQLSMPYEIPADSFVIDAPPTDTVWSRDLYGRLLPTSWRGYTPIYQAYLAGEAGRTAIIAHGTTIDPSYYRGQRYYPQTPSLGCLCCHEAWSADSGLRVESDQQQLVDALRSTGASAGYTVVIDVSGGKGPVRLSEVLPELLDAERRN